MKKNDFITLEIEDIGVGGEGIGTIFMYEHLNNSA